jgi:hypothetical protein
MEWLTELELMAGLLLVRCGVPLAITLLVGHWLARLDKRWQAEQRAAHPAGRL